MRPARETKCPEAALARLLAMLARRREAVAIHAGRGGEPDDIPEDVLALATQSGLVATEAGRHRILPAGLAWLKRRLSGADGFQEQHRLIEIREIGSGAERRQLAVNALESPLAWLRQRRDKSGRPILTDAQFEAGERLRGDFHHAGLSPRVTQCWDGHAVTSASPRGAPGDLGSLRASIAGARQRLRSALDEVGPELSGVLVDVCCHLKGIEAAEVERGWPVRSGKVVLLLALSSLARHYGLVAPEPPAGLRRSRLTHWGDAGYRPTMAAWEEGHNPHNR